MIVFNCVPIAYIIMTTVVLVISLLSWSMVNNRERTINKINVVVSNWKKNKIDQDNNWSNKINVVLLILLHSLESYYYRNKRKIQTFGASSHFLGVMIGDILSNLERASEQCKISKPLLGRLWCRSGAKNSLRTVI